ncbi:MAG: Carbonic anhydrase 2 [Candidatus Scalindua arabica]|uniref:carbonic anhydrase n=1 Tax=Candidatus Scalindua arabica TaxID=1127984 RepID=A0A941W2P4_9BACT|nr:Carbonic anhydrase 2 [Candidatus Scalindua arabica]
MTILSSENALQKLMEGNKRYVAEKPVYPNQTTVRRAEIAEGQHPFAIIVSCSDSRVPPEIIFDQGLGDLFVIRVAGNTVDNMVMASVEYAAEHLNVQLALVLGHKRCGAVDAAIKSDGSRGSIDNLIKAIKPAVEKAKNQTGDLQDNAVKANVKMVVDQLKSSKPILCELVKDNKLMIIGAFYDLDSGLVDVIT